MSTTYMNVLSYAKQDIQLYSAAIMYDDMMTRAP